MTKTVNIRCINEFGLLSTLLVIECKPEDLSVLIVCLCLERCHFGTQGWELELQFGNFWV